MNFLTKAEYIELQIASLSGFETYLYNRMFPKVFRMITDLKYMRYVKYMMFKDKQWVERQGKAIWEKINKK